MKRKKTLATLLLGMAAALTTVANAQERVIIIVPSEATETEQTVALTTATEITLGKTDLTITDGAQSITLPYAQIGELILTDPSGVDKITGEQQQYRLRENPVGDMLTIEGHDGAAAAVAIYSQSGAAVARVPEWNGEQLEVSRLAPGMYILTINRQAIKFIKK